MNRKSSPRLHVSSRRFSWDDHYNSYQGDPEKAIREALNVLGTGVCSVNTCQGCKWEEQEARSILIGALGLYSPRETWCVHNYPKDLCPAGDCPNFDHEHRSEYLSDGPSSS